jgi:hypothetical protein
VENGGLSEQLSTCTSSDREITTKWAQQVYAPCVRTPSTKGQNHFI